MGSGKNNHSDFNGANKQYPEFISYPEFSPLTDSSSKPKRAVGMLETSSSEKATKTDAVKKDNKIQSFFRKMLVSTTVAVAAVITAETIGIIGSSGVSIAKLEEPYRTETGYSYSMWLDGYSDDDGELYAEVYNSSAYSRIPVEVEPSHEEYWQDEYEQYDSYPQEEQKAREQEMQWRYAWFSIEGMIPDADYTLEIFCGNLQLHKDTIRWQSEPRQDSDTGDPGDIPVDDPGDDPNDIERFFTIYEDRIEFDLPLSELVTDFEENDYLVIRIFQEEKEAGDPVEIRPGESSISGYFAGLEPGTEYLIYLEKNQQPVENCAWFVTSLGEKPVFPEIPYYESWIELSGSTVECYFPLIDYESNDNIYIQVLPVDVADDVRDPIPVLADNLYASGLISDLNPGSMYTIQLFVNEIPIDSGFSVFILEDDFIDANIKLFSDRIEYHIQVIDYEDREDDYFEVLLFNEETEPVRNPVDVLNPSDPYADGSFSNLQPGTEYTVQLYVNDDNIGESWWFKTPAEIRISDDQGWFIND